MQIDQIRARLRPRSTWESIDLGFHMTRHWWPMLTFSWMVTALPAFLLISLVFYDNPTLASLLFWWLKPAYEQLPLCFASRALFNEPLSKRQLLQQLPRWLARTFIPSVTWRRLSMNRSYTAPVDQLEGLRAGQRSRRIRTLSDARNVGAWLTITCLHLEAVIYFSIISLVWMLIPSELDLMAWGNKNELLALHLVNLAYFLGVACIAPFYVVSGFSLYLNKRTNLEGWDIELEFRRLLQRSQQLRKGLAAAISLIAVGIVFAWMPGNQAHAQSSAIVSSEQAKTHIEEIMAHEDFGKTETVKRWRLRNPLEFDDPKLDDNDFSLPVKFLEFITEIGYVLIWLAVAVIVAILIYQLPKWKKALSLPARSERSRQEAPNVVFGLDIRKEALPDNIAKAARELYHANNFRQALSLLYRGALSVMVNQHGLLLRSSDTEGECLKQVQQHRESVAGYFAELTRAWTLMAYAHHTPSSQVMDSLCERWDQAFGSQP